MRIAALYDIHGNLPALEAVLRDVRAEHVDLIVFGGDLLPGPLPRETLDCALALDIPSRILHGNGDRVVAELIRGEKTTEVPERFREVMRWNAAQLTPADADTIAAWPDTIALDSGVGATLFCHATPRNDIDIFTRLTADEQIAPAFAGTSADIVVCGHTHMQFDRRLAGRRVINAGSVGMPFGEPGAYWALIDRDVELRRTEYDLQAAAERIARSAYPEARQFAEHNVLSPPSEAAMLAAFSRG
ncbi:MAG TPA: metallophosphoesterase family protein [Gemmatimonadaceae bacterium]|nr:metallophosphoesterase family protein [Gemmatimonadaceae bacterium]